jgi:hypothetical protein
MEDALTEVVKGHEEVFSKKVGATPQPLPTLYETDSLLYTCLATAYKT